MNTMKKLLLCGIMLNTTSYILQANSEEELMRFVEAVVDHKLKEAGIAGGGQKNISNPATESAYKALHKAPKRIIEFNEKEQVLVAALQGVIALAEEQKKLLASPADMTDFLAQNKAQHALHSHAAPSSWPAINEILPLLKDEKLHDRKNDILVKIAKSPVDSNVYDITITTDSLAAVSEHDLRPAHNNFAKLISNDLPNYTYYKNFDAAKDKKIKIEGEITGETKAYGANKSIAISCHKAVLQQLVQQHNITKAKRNSLGCDEAGEEKQEDLDRIAKTFGQEVPAANSAEQPKVEQKPAPKKGWF